MQNQSSDPVIDRIREVRHEISRSVGHDPQRLIAHYMELQKQYGDRLVRTMPPKKEEKPSEAA